jgi:hypothetical protein
MEDQVRRSIMIALIALLALVLAAPIAVAARPAKPQPPPVPVEGSQDLPAGAVFGRCDFPIRYELSGKAKLITLPGGRFITTAPDQYATLTPILPDGTLDLAHQERINITGSLHQSTDEKGKVVTVAAGRNILGDPQAGFVLAIGNFSFVTRPAGGPGPEDDILVQPLQGDGQLIDICELLSS